MNIRVTEIPNCTWILEGDSFWCTHSEKEVVLDTIHYMTYDGPDEYDVEGYACAECGVPLEGFPMLDRADK